MNKLPMTPRTSFPLRKLCSLLALAGLSSATWSQSGDLNLKEVTINAGRIQQRQFDAPAGVSSVSGEAIRSSGPQVNLSDVLGGMPGVVALNRNNYAQDVQISIRGFGSRSAFGVQGIRLIADGIPATIPDGQGQASTVSLTSADRIEVLRGPLAQLYGNSSGGVIQTFTREAGPQPSADIQMFTGSYGLMRTDMQASARSENGKVGIVADLSSFRIEGWRDNSAARREQINTVVTVDPQPDTRVRVVVNAFEMPQAQDPVGLSASQLARSPQQAGTNTVLDQTRKIVSQRQLGLVLDQRIDGDLKFQGRVYGGTRSNLQYQASSSTTSPANQNGTWVGLDRHFMGLGLQLQGQKKQGSVPMDWVIGFDSDRSSEHRQGGAAALGEKKGSFTRDEQNIASNGDWFGQTNWYLGEQWTATAGLRSSRVTLRSNDNFLSDGNGSGSVVYRATTPVVGITWHATDTLNVYGNLGKGLETPTLAAVAYSIKAGAIANQFNPNLLASTSRHQEVGLKWQPAPERRVELAMFRIGTDNEVVSSLSSAGKTTYINAPKTRRQGLELSLQERIAPHWQASWNVTAMSAKYRSTFVSTGNTIYSGNSLPAVPGKQVQAALTWTQLPGRNVNSARLSGAQVTLEWMARSRLWANDLNTAYASGHGIFNLRMRHGVQLGAVSVESFVGINNLGDQKYVGSVITNQSAGQYYEPALPRNWTVGINAKIAL
jgi:iron complex outermembrane receptor protein